MTDEADVRFAIAASPGNCWMLRFVEELSLSQRQADPCSWGLGGDDEAAMRAQSLAHLPPATLGRELPRLAAGGVWQLKSQHAPLHHVALDLVFDRSIFRRSKSFGRARNATERPCMPNPELRPHLTPSPAYPVLFV